MGSLHSMYHGRVEGGSKTVSGGWGKNEKMNAMAGEKEDNVWDGRNSWCLTLKWSPGLCQHYASAFSVQ